MYKISKEIKAFCCASEACYALTENDLYVWGWNEHGNLATGDREDRLQPESLKTNIINPNTEVNLIIIFPQRYRLEEQL